VVRRIQEALFRLGNVYGVDGLEQLGDAQRLKVVTAVIRQASPNAFEHLMGNAAIADVRGWGDGSVYNDDAAMTDDQ
jgi:hypothetical protein